MDKIKTFRKLLLDSVDEKVKDGDIISLSGGVDSVTLVFACKYLKKKISCVTTSLENYPSIDVKVALSVSKAMNVPITYLPVKRCYKDLFYSVKMVNEVTSIVRKTLIQCFHSNIEIYKYAKINGGRLVVGMTADAIYAVDKESMIRRRKHGDEYWMWARYEGIKNRFDVGNTIPLEKLALQVYGIDVIDPYQNDRLIDFSLTLDYNELHRPIEKAIAKKAFIEYWNQGKWFRRRSNLQVGSGVREYHDTILRTLYNKGHKKIIGVYNDIAEGRVKYDGEK